MCGAQLMIFGFDWSRWVKYEEDVEPRGVRWSKPYVPTVHLKSLYDLKEIFKTQPVLLNVEIDSLERTCGTVVDAWAKEGLLVDTERMRVLQALLRRHVHLYERPSGVSTLGIHPSCLTKQRKCKMLKTKFCFLVLRSIRFDFQFPIRLVPYGFILFTQ